MDLDRQWYREKEPEGRPLLNHVMDLLIIVPFHPVHFDPEV